MATVAPIRARTRRNTELGLLIPALGVGLLGFIEASLGTTKTIAPTVWWYTAILVVLALAMHVVLRWRAPYADPVILPVIITITGISLAMMDRLTYAADQKIASLNTAADKAQASGDTARASSLRDQASSIWTGFDVKQLQWLAIGVVAAIVVLFVLRDHRTLRRYTYTAMIVGLGLLLLPLVPGIGQTINGSQIWIHVGSFSFQPAELAKIALAIFFAGYLVKNRDTLSLAGKKILGLQLPRIRDLGPILVAWGVSVAILVFEKDLGTSLLFFGMFVAMLYLATSRVSWVIIGLTLFAVGATFAAKTSWHVQMRIQDWLHALDNNVYNAKGGSYQLVQGLFGFANGGLFGTGLGQGRPDLISHAESDFIIAAIAEELGLTGFIAVVMLYIVLVERGLRTAIGVRDGFGKLLAGGLAFTIGLQCFIVIGGVTRVIPLTGMTLPFLAYGGSSLLANWMIAALLLRISDSARRPAPDIDDDLIPVAVAA